MEEHDNGDSIYYTTDVSSPHQMIEIFLVHTSFEEILTCQYMEQKNNFDITTEL